MGEFIKMEHIVAPAAKVKVAYGNWRETSLALCAAEFKAGTQVVGTCNSCQEVLPAVKLKLVRLPFGRGEAWKCEECR